MTTRQELLAGERILKASYEARQAVLLVLDQGGGTDSLGDSVAEFLLPEKMRRQLAEIAEQDVQGVQCVT